MIDRIGFTGSGFYLSICLKYYERMDMALYLQLNFLNKILGSIMYLVMGLAFYAPYIFKKESKEK